MARVSNGADIEVRNARPSLQVEIVSDGPKVTDYEPTCTCRRLMAGGRAPTEAREWSEDCPEHGIDSTWWAEVGKTKMAAQNDRAVVMQAIDAVARAGKLELAQAAMKALDRLTLTIREQAG